MLEIFEPKDSISVRLRRWHDLMDPGTRTLFQFPVCNSETLFSYRKDNILILLIPSGLEKNFF